MPAPPYGRGHEAMLRSVRLSVCLSVPFSGFVPIARWRHARVASSNAFVRGQHGRYVCIKMLYYLRRYKFTCSFVARYIVRPTIIEKSTFYNFDNCVTLTFDLLTSFS